MQIDALSQAGTTPVASSPAAGPLAPAGAMTTRREAQQTPLPHPVNPWPEQTNQLRTVLTVDMMRDELITIGVEPTDDNVAVAQSLAKLALPLTPQTMVEAHVSLTAAGPGTLPQSFALAKVLSLPPSPGVLRGLSSVMASSGGSQANGSVFSFLQGVLPAVLPPQSAMPVDGVIETAEVTTRRDLPIELLQRLGLTLDFNATPTEIATRMQIYSRQVLRSTENRIAQAMAQEGALAEVEDLRTLLLRLANSSSEEEVRDGAAALASHIEGQQLLNAGAAHPGSQSVNPNAVAYMAFPLALAGEQSMVEMRLWPRDEEREGSWVDEDVYPVKATVRMTMSNLGRIQANLLGDLYGFLSCRLSAEKPGVLQLLSRNSVQLAEMLTNAGWSKNEIACDERGDWAPLWTGGEALSKPRKRIDWRA